MNAAPSTDELLKALLAAPAAARTAALNALREPTAPPSARLLYKIGEAAELLAVSRSTIWRLTRRGRLRQVEVTPGTFRIPAEELQRFVRNGVRS